MIFKVQCIALVFCIISCLYLNAQQCTLTSIFPSNLDTVQDVILIQSELVQYELIPASWQKVEMSIAASDREFRLNPVDPVWLDEMLLMVIADPEALAKSPQIPWISKPTHELYACTNAVFESREREVVIRDAYIEILVNQPATEQVHQQIEIFPSLPYFTFSENTANPSDSLFSGFRYTKPQYEDLVILKQQCCDGSGIPGSGCVENVFIPQKTMTFDYHRITSPAVCNVITIPGDTLWIPGVAEYQILPAEDSVKYPDAIKLKRSLLAYEAGVDTTIIEAKTFKYQYEKLLSPATVQITTYPAEYELVDRIVMKDTVGFIWQTANTFCHEHLDERFITLLQERLTELGYICGAIDGRIGPMTWEALATFQWENGLQVGGITQDTLKSLGLLAKLLPNAAENIRP
jgi:hypothetical protein